MSEPHASSSSSRSPLLLLVDDGDDSAVLCADLLATLGYAAEKVPDLAAARARCHLQLISAVIADLQRHGRGLARLRDECTTCCIGLTGMTSEPADGSVGSALVDGLLVKPLELRQVAVVLARCLGEVGLKARHPRSAEEMRTSEPSDDEDASGS